MHLNNPLMVGSGVVVSSWFWGLVLDDVDSVAVFLFLITFVLLLLVSLFVILH